MLNRVVHAPLSVGQVDKTVFHDPFGNGHIEFAGSEILPQQFPRIAGHQPSQWRMGFHKTHCGTPLSRLQLSERRSGMVPQCAEELPCPNAAAIGGKALLLFYTDLTVCLLHSAEQAGHVGHLSMR